MVERSRLHRRTGRERRDILWVAKELGLSQGTGEASWHLSAHSRYSPAANEILVDGFHQRQTALIIEPLRKQSSLSFPFLITIRRVKSHAPSLSIVAATSSPKANFDVTRRNGNALRHQPTQHPPLPRPLHLRLLPHRLPTPPQTPVAAIRTPRHRFHPSSAQVLPPNLRLLSPRFLLLSKRERERETSRRDVLVPNPIHPTRKSARLLPHHRHRDERTPTNQRLQSRPPAPVHATHLRRPLPKRKLGLGCASRHVRRS